MKFNGDDWVTVGEAGFSAGQAEYTSIAISKSGIPYVVYKDNGNGGKASVMRYDGSKWVAVGKPGFSKGFAEYSSIAIDEDGAPYVAYRDSSIGKKAVVMKFNGNEWTCVGNIQASAGKVAYLSLALDTHGVPYLAFLDVDHDAKATVLKYDAKITQWHSLGNEGFSAGEALYTAIAIDKNGIPYVVYEDYSDADAHSNKATVMKLEQK